MTERPQITRHLWRCTLMLVLVGVTLYTNVSLIRSLGTLNRISSTAKEKSTEIIYGAVFVSLEVSCLQQTTCPTNQSKRMLLNEPIRVRTKGCQACNSMLLVQSAGKHATRDTQE